MAHYQIHLTDYPPIAEKGLGAARRYAAIAPAAPHALHMPSHIFTRRGYWQDSVESNRASAAAAQDHFNQLHAMDYMTYAYLQMAQDQAAKRVLDDMNAIQENKLRHFVPGFALATIPSAMRSSGPWSEAASLTLSEGFPW